MPSDSPNAIHAVFEKLQKEALRIRALEAEAKEALFVRDDQETYTLKLKEKTTVLMELPDTLEPLLDDLDGEVRSEIQAGLEDFARRAGQALGLSSLFYMSALLYPDEYVEGDRNDLEKFIDRFERKFSRREACPDKRM